MVFEFMDHLHMICSLVLVNNYKVLVSAQKVLYLSIQYYRNIKLLRFLLSC